MKQPRKANGSTALLDSSECEGWPDLHAAFRDMPEPDLRRCWRALLADMLTRDPDVRGVLLAHTIVHDRLIRRSPGSRS
jgi:hypothetical protein